MRRFITFVRRVWKDQSEDNLTLVAAGVAYYSLLALFPSVIAVVTVYALVADADQVEEQIRPILGGLPPDARSLLVRQLEGIVKTSDGSLSLGLFVSLFAAVWAASGGVQALMTGLNIVTEQTETRNFLRLKATALGLTFGALVAAAVALGLIAVFPVALRWLHLDAGTEVTVQVLRWVLLVLLVTTGLSVMYRFGPAPHKARWRWVSPGITVAIGLWIVASAGLSIYVSRFGNYDKTYGTLAGAIILLLWLFMSAFAVLLGAEVDSIRLQPASPGSGKGEVLNGKEERRMSTVVESVDVAVPVHTAYNQWTQFEEFPRFMDGVSEIRQVNDELTHWVVEIAGQRREFDAKITEQHPDERVAWTSLDGPTHAGVVTFHRLDDTHTRVTAQMDIDPDGFAETVADKAGVIDRKVKGDMKRFKEFIESRGLETGAWRGDIDRPTP